MLAELLPAEIFGFLLVFARIGAAVMVLPGIGERYVPARARLGLALGLSAVLYPVVRAGLPGLPAAPLVLFLLLLGEIVHGLFIGGAARLVLSGLHVAGVAISFMSGLSFAQTVDPNQGTQGSLVSSLLTLLGIVMVFSSGLYALMIVGLHDSYTVFPAGEVPPVADFARYVVQTVSASFKVGVQLAAPFIVYGLVFYIGLGMLQRLMPQLQLFFVAMPLQITIALVMLMLTLSAVMMWFLNFFEDQTGYFVLAH